MNVCFFMGDISSVGGAERATTLLVNALVEHSDWSITLLSVHQHADVPTFSISNRIRCAELFDRPCAALHHIVRVSHALRRFVLAHKIDVLVDVDVILDMFTFMLPRSVLVIGWEHFNFKQNPDKGLRKFTRRISVLRDAALVVLTQRDKELYEEGLRTIRCPLVAIPNCFNDALPMAAQYERDSRKIVSCGRLVPVKGFDLLIEAARRVLPAHPGWTWVIYGDGELRVELEQMIGQYGLLGRVILAGKVDDLSPEYNSAALYVLTSRAEGLPMVLLEAKQHHLPIVSFDCETGPRELVDDNVNGLLVEPGNVEILARAVDSLIEDEGRRLQFAAHASDGLERYEPRHVAEMWMQLIDSLFDDNA